MPLYHLTFHGREKGAIGVRSRFVKELDAPSEEMAWVRCYETHEHISRLSCVLVTEEVIQAQRELGERES